MGVHKCESKADFDQQLKDSGDKLVVVDFYAEWCGPCKMIAPKVEALTGKYKNVVFLKVDVDVCDDIAEKYKISAMPTFIFIKDGDEKIDEVVGANEDALKDKIEALK